MIFLNIPNINEHLVKQNMVHFQSNPWVEGEMPANMPFYAGLPPLGKGKKVLTWGGWNPEPLLSEESSASAAYSSAVLESIPQSFCWRCVSLQKGNWDFGSKRRCLTLRAVHSVLLFPELSLWMQVWHFREDLAALWKKSASLPPFSVQKRQCAGESSEPIYCNLRNVLLCSPCWDASVLQRDLDVPLVSMALAAFHAWCCQLCSCVPCCPSPGSLDVSLSAGDLTPRGWCLKTERWKTHIDNTHILSQMSLKTSSVVLLHRAASIWSLASLLAGLQVQS